MRERDVEIRTDGLTLRGSLAGPDGVAAPGVVLPCDLPPRPQRRHAEARSLRELMAIDPAQVYARLAAPTFLLGAANDLQCKPDDVSRIAALLGDKATPHIEPDLTHILRKDEAPPSFLACGS
jgi:hypothetical protein